MQQQQQQLHHHHQQQLVGGFNSFGKYARQIGSFPHL